MKKAVLINIPLTETLFPSPSLAAIAPVFKKNGYQVVINDINLRLFSEFDNDRSDEIYDWCEFTRDLTDDTVHVLKEWLQKQIDDIYQQQPDIVAVSVFTLHSINFSNVLLPLLKNKMPGVPIIVGGNGISSNLGMLTTNKPYGEYLKENNLCDFAIFGEGEISLDQLLSGNLDYPGINVNNPVQVDDLDSLDPPDYTDFNFEQYRDKRLLITGSRGCVRHCTFCDIDLVWPKFKYRSPENQVNEIITHSKKYNIKRFEFTDSLINGSVSNWIKFNELLAEAKQKDPDLADITYSGQFICREKQSQPAIMYELMHYAGARQITVGIESFSERIRNDMKKKFSDSAIDYHLEQCGRWNIPNIFLMIVGYPTETIEDHQRSLECLRKYKVYSDMGTIFMIRWGLTMHIYQDTPLFKNANAYGIDVTQQSEIEALYTWTSTLNPGLDFVERVKRRVELYVESNRLGYSQPNGRSELAALISLLENYRPTKSNYFEIKALA